MATITSNQMRAAFALAREVYDGKVSPEIAAKRLNEETGLNISSARDFIAQFRHMLKGEVFKRSQSAEALEYFLTSILQSRGPRAAENALAAAWKHIAYYEGIERTHLNKLRAVAAAFQSSLPGAMSAGVHEARFAADVVRSQQDSEAARQERLRNADPIPAAQVMATMIYGRNPDVVAAVLARADGVCEFCKNPAPFTRRSDGTPYLEVHHRKQLAQGGHDTVENALALCPNCHRKAHHG